MVIDAGPKNKTNEGILRSEWRSALKKRLTEPTLLEMSGSVNQELTASSFSSRQFVPFELAPANLHVVVFHRGR